MHSHPPQITNLFHLSQDGFRELRNMTSEGQIRWYNRTLATFDHRDHVSKHELSVAQQIPVKLLVEVPVPLRLGGACSIASNRRAGNDTEAKRSSSLKKRIGRDRPIS